MNKLLFFIFVLQINAICFGGENPLLFHYKTNEIETDETDKICDAHSTLIYSAQTKTFGACFTSTLHCSQLRKTLAVLAYHLSRKDIRKVDWQVLGKNPSEKLEIHSVDMRRLSILKSDIQRKKFDRFLFIKEEGGQPKYIVRKFVVPLNYFFSQPYLFKFTTKQCTSRKIKTDSTPFHHIIEVTITKEDQTLRWHSEYIVAFLGIGGLAAYGVYHKWFKK
jgi:hypothetical protein